MSEQPADPHIIGDFRIEKRLGAGGMGVVYLARQITLDRSVALKILGPSLTSSTDIRRFQREAQAAARLKHPGIAEVYYVGQESGICFMAMEYIDGASVRQVIGRLGKTDSMEATIDSVVSMTEAADELQTIRFDVETPSVSPSSLDDNDGEELITPQAAKITANSGHIHRCCEIVRDAALALEHARKQGVVHRDIKPENLMVDRQGNTYVIDFGIARFFEDRTLTYTGQLVGTPIYMSPEQVTGRIELDHRTDIYSLGMVLYELLTLRPPITAATREAVLRSIATKSVPPVSWQNASVPPSLESIVHKAISRDPNERYQTGGEFADDLQLQLEGKTVLAKPYRHMFDPREIDASRPRWLIFAVVFCLLFCLVALAGSLSAALGVTVQDKSLWLYGLALSSVWILAAAGSLFAGLGILAGRPWARIAGALVCVLFVAYTAAGTLAAFQALADQPLTLRAAPLGVLAFVCLAAGSIIWGLFTRRTSDWFRYARSLRVEHQAERTRR